MTERRRGSVDRSASQFTIGPNALEFDGSRLTLHVDEVCAPVPRRMVGKITVDVGAMGEVGYPLDSAGRHVWRPIDPGAHVEVAFDTPGVSWTGRGYLDMNWGDEPLEAGFRFWDWSRFELDSGEAAILYRTEPRAGTGCQMGLRFDKHGSVDRFDPEVAATLSRTPVWRIARPALSHGGGRVSHVRTFEDTPFYSRSEVTAELFGAPRRGVHESFDGDRLKRNLIKALLPVRMPRRA